jgi:tetratricopeptide (TPR) repeat protein
MAQTTNLNIRAAIHPDFTAGLRRLEACEAEVAVVLFKEALRTSMPLDPHYCTYQSYYGLALVLSGDAKGLDHCRRAAQADAQDADIYYNLAQAELRLRNRGAAVEAVAAGLRIAPQHQKLLKLRATLGVRRPPFFSVLGRDNPINKLIGKLTYRRSRSRQSGI